MCFTMCDCDVAIWRNIETQTTHSLIIRPNNQLLFEYSTVSGMYFHLASSSQSNVPAKPFFYVCMFFFAQQEDQSAKSE